MEISCFSKELKKKLSEAKIFYNEAKLLRKDKVYSLPNLKIILPNLRKTWSSYCGKMEIGLLRAQ